MLGLVQSMLVKWGPLGWTVVDPKGYYVVPIPLERLRGNLEAEFSPAILLTEHIYHKRFKSPYSRVCVISISTAIIKHVINTHKLWPDACANVWKHTFVIQLPNIFRLWDGFQWQIYTFARCFPTRQLRFWSLCLALFFGVTSVARRNIF